MRADARSVDGLVGLGAGDVRNARDRVIALAVGQLLRLLGAGVDDVLRRMQNVGGETTSLTGSAAKRKSSTDLVNVALLPRRRRVGLLRTLLNLLRAALCAVSAARQ